MARPKGRSGAVKRNSEKFCSNMFKELRKCESGKTRKRKGSKTCIQSAIRIVTHNLKAKGRVSCKGKKRNN